VITLILPSGVLKRLWVDKEALSERRPAWVVEEATGLCRRHHVREAVITGIVMPRGNAEDDVPLYPTGPALWLETTGEVQLKL